MNDHAEKSWLRPHPTSGEILAWISFIAAIAASTTLPAWLPLIGGST